MVTHGDVGGTFLLMHALLVRQSRTVHGSSRVTLI
jgi:hypothetical protein